MNIHSSSVIADTAVVDATAEIGPFCVIGPDVTIGAGVKLHSHVIVQGHTEIGEGTEVYPFCSFGMPPQDMTYTGEPTQVTIGKNVLIRENVTIHRGTVKDSAHTRIGDNSMLMVGVHVAHDCQVGENAILTNLVTLGGHVHVGDFAIIGGLAAIHQFVHIGKYAMIGGMSGVEYDVIPFALVHGERASLKGVNIIGMRRRGFGKSEVHELRAAVNGLFKAADETFDNRLQNFLNENASSLVTQELVAFLSRKSKRGFLMPEKKSDV
jgi:UDP-N-acetylglucosamine acyltransferase